VVEIDFPSAETVVPAFMREVADVHRDLFDENGELYGENIRGKVERCLALTEREYLDAVEERERHRERAEAALEGFDLLLAPTLATGPPPADVTEVEIRAELTQFTFPFNALGWPALAVGPVQLVGRFTSPLVVAISMFTVVVATIAVNIAANVVSPANDFANAFPRYISFKTGGLITGIVGIVIQPWKLLADASGYIYTWLLGYSGGLGSIAGVLIADYWIVRRRALDLEDLYLPHGRYGAWNPAAVIATLAGCALAWGGLVIPVMRPLYDYAWFVGFFGAGALYIALKRGPATAIA